MPEIKQISLEAKYRVLQYFSYTLSIMGVLTIAGGIYLFFSMKPSIPKDEFEAMQMAMTNQMGNMMGGTALVVGLITGVLMIVQAQLLMLFIDLERNQRESIELQKQQLEATK